MTNVKCNSNIKSINNSVDFIDSDIVTTKLLNEFDPLVP